MFLMTAGEESADAGVESWYRHQRQIWGYLPNYAPAFATRPEVGVAWSRLNGLIREGMDRRRFELATVAAARALASTYCLAAHSKFLRDVCDDEPVMRAVAADPSGASLDPVDRAVVEFATKVATSPASITAGDVERLREVGLADADIADLIFAVASRCFFATVLDATGAEPDHQLAETFEESVREELVVGRPFAQPAGG